MSKSQKFTLGSELTNNIPNSIVNGELSLCSGSQKMSVLSAANSDHDPKVTAVTQCATSDSHSTRTVILLIGAPGVGKSLLGTEFAGESSEGVEFLSVGNRLRGWMDITRLVSFGKTREKWSRQVCIGLQRGLQKRWCWSMSRRSTTPLT